MLCYVTRVCVRRYPPRAGTTVGPSALFVMSRVSVFALAVVALCTGRPAASGSQDLAGKDELVYMLSQNKELLDDSGLVRTAKPAVLVIFVNLDDRKNMQYVLKRARKVAVGPCAATARKRKLSFAIASLLDSKSDMEEQLGTQGGFVRSSPRGHLLAQSGTLGRRGEPRRLEAV